MGARRVFRSLRRVGERVAGLKDMVLVEDWGGWDGWVFVLGRGEDRGESGGVAGRVAFLQRVSFS